MRGQGLPRQLSYDSGLLEELSRVYGSALPRALEALLEPPTRYYLRVNVLRASPERVLDSIREMGVRAYLDEVVEEALWLPVERGEAPRDGWDCVIVVDKRAAESVLVGANVYGPGVVAVEGDCRRGSLAAVVPDAVRDYVVAVAEVVDVEAASRGRGLVARNVGPRYRLPSFRETVLYREGMIYEQSLPSMMVGRVAIEGGERLIVDMCAAPVGKTGHVVELTRGKARVLAFDHSRRKVEKMREELQRLGHLGLVEVRRADSRYLDRDYPSLVGKVDLVILDPPCTSIGVIPKVYDAKSYRDVVNSAEYQRQFLRVAAKLLKPCGRLVYSTCTVTLAENEANVAYAEEELGLRLEEPQLRHPRSSRGVGVSEAIRFHPHVHGLPGYFIAVMRKRC